MNTHTETRRGSWSSRIGLGLLATALLLGGCLDANEPGNLVPRTVDEDPSLPSIEVNGTKLHAETFGDPAAPVIVVLHSGPGHDYRSLLRFREPVDGVRLEDRHRLVYWDQRGCGLSRRHDANEVTGDIYEADLVALLDKVSPGRPVVFVAKSWGAMFGTRFIGRHPERVAGAVLMEPGPLTGALYDDIKDGIRELDLGSEWLNDMTWAQTIVSPDGHARADYALLQGQLSDSQPRFHPSKTNREPLWRLGAVAFTQIQKEGIKNGKAVWDFTTGLDQFRRPVRFIASERNEVLGVEFQKRQMKAYPDADLAIVTGAGHDFNWTEPEQTRRHIDSYLAKIGF